MCLAPCFKGCSDEEYAAEVGRVQSYFDSSGDSLSRELSAEREAASVKLAFEDAATIHVRVEKLKPIVSQLPEIVHRLDQFSALMIQPSSVAGCVAFFRVEGGRIAGPIAFSIQAAEHAKSQSMEGRVQEILQSLPPAKAKSALENMEHLALLNRRNLLRRCQRRVAHAPHCSRHFAGVPRGEARSDRLNRKSVTNPVSGSWRKLFFRPFGAGSSFHLRPTACAVGCILPPICGLMRDGCSPLQGRFTPAKPPPSYPAHCLPTHRRSDHNRACPQQHSRKVEQNRRHRRRIRRETLEPVAECQF